VKGIMTAASASRRICRIRGFGLAVVSEIQPGRANDGASDAQSRTRGSQGYSSERSQKKERRKSQDCYRSIRGEGFGHAKTGEGGLPTEFRKQQERRRESENPKHSAETRILQTFVYGRAALASKIALTSEA
jgi:hypothetical protein